MILTIEPLCELSGERGLASTLESDKHDHCRWVLREAKSAGLATENGDKFVVHDLDDLLGWIQSPTDFRAERPLLDPRTEPANNRQRDVGLEQGSPDLPNGRVDVSFR